MVVVSLAPTTQSRVLKCMRISFADGELLFKHGLPLFTIIHFLSLLIHHHHQSQALFTAHQLAVLCSKH